MKLRISILFVIICFVAIVACSDNPVPKPKGYFRIDFPEKNYTTYDAECPFMFDIPAYSTIQKNRDEFCWFNIYFPENKATIYLTYKPVDNDLDSLLEDSHSFVYKHTIKADAIKPTRFENDSLNVYGILYDLKGNTASSIQFFLTDSINHFLRGSLYFETIPNKDSLAPVINFIREDIIVLMESFEWK
jgi:gliding motility-associated lipoprotein GldD